MQPTSQPPPGINRKPMKRPDKVVLAERKNKREEARLRMYLNYLNKQGLQAGFSVEKEKRQIRHNVAKVQRTSGNSKVGIPPTDANDTTFEKSEYFKGGAKISEKALTKWRATEKEIERILLREEAEKAREELEKTDMGWLKELFKDFDMDSSSDEDDDFQPRPRYKRNYVTLPDPADVFESLRPEVPPSDNIYALKSDNFTVNRWQRCIVNNYVSQVAKPPGKITRKMRRPLSEISRGSDVDPGKESMAMRPHSAIGVMRRTFSSPDSLQSDDPSLCSDDVTDAASPLYNDSSLNNGPPDLVSAKSKLKREKITCSLLDIKPFELASKDTGKNPTVKPPLGRNDSSTRLQNSHSRTNGDDNSVKKEQRVSFADKDTVLDEQTAKMNGASSVIKPIMKRRPQSAGARITTKPDGSNVTGFITAPILKRQDSKLRMISEATIPESTQEHDEAPSVTDDSNISPVPTSDHEPHKYTYSDTTDDYDDKSKAPVAGRPLNRTVSRSFSQSAFVSDDISSSSPSSTAPPTPPEAPADDKPRMSQWRRQLRADAPPGLSGNKSEIKTYVTISRSERRRQLREMVENNYLDLQKMITKEKDRRLHSRLALFVTLLEFHQKRKDDKKKAKEEKRMEQNEMLFGTRRKTTNPVYNVLTTKR